LSIPLGFFITLRSGISEFTFKVGIDPRGALKVIAEVDTMTPPTVVRGFAH
jgi:hypothetical protein